MNKDDNEFQYYRLNLFVYVTNRLRQLFNKFIKYLLCEFNNIVRTYLYYRNFNVFMNIKRN